MWDRVEHVGSCHVGKCGDFALLRRYAPLKILVTKLLFTQSRDSSFLTLYI